MSYDSYDFNFQDSEWQVDIYIGLLPSSFGGSWVTTNFGNFWRLHVGFYITEFQFMKLCFLLENTNYLTFKTVLDLSIWQR